MTSTAICCTTACGRSHLNRTVGNRPSQGGQLATAVILFCNLLGCTAAYNSRWVSAPDGRHKVCCYVRGAWGRGYLADTHKKVIVTIYASVPNQKSLQLLEKEYRIKGSDVEWRAEWTARDDLSIVFYDYGPRVESPYSLEDAAPKRTLATIKYRFDANSNTYAEEPAK
jgi:hypothetical protein